MPKIVDVDERRAALTDAAARLIAGGGIEAATLRDVAAEAGMTTGALTHYFADKRELLLHTFQSSLHHRRSTRGDREPADPSGALMTSLEGALPLDPERTRHWMVTIAFCSQAAGDAVMAATQRDAYREFRDHIADLAVRAGLAAKTSASHTAEQLIAVADGIAIQAIFDPASWPAPRQLTALHTGFEAVTRSYSPTLAVP
jgi:AcrR family transcriptional regulator